MNDWRTLTLRYTVVPVLPVLGLVGGLVIWILGTLRVMRRRWAARERVYRILRVRGWVKGERSNTEKSGQS